MNKKHGLFKISLAKTCSLFFSLAPFLACYRSLSLSLRSLALDTTWLWYELIMGTSWFEYELARYELTWVRLDRHPNMLWHRYITAYFATSSTPVSGDWSTNSCTGKSEITVRVPVLYTSLFITPIAPLQKYVNIYEFPRCNTVSVSHYNLCHRQSKTLHRPL